MRTLVLDASVVVKWFRGDEPHVAEARDLLAEYRSGALVVVAPRLLPLELLSAAGRGWGWPAAELTRLAAALERLGLDYREPPLSEVADWVGRGLTSSDAVYAAVASSADLRLVTDDDRLLTAAAPVAQRLATA